MTDRIEKAYYLKQEELAVLLALQGVQQLYGFRMDMAGNMNKEELHKILFEMARKNLLSVTGRCIEMDTDLSAVLKDLVQAETVLHLTGTEEYPECCVYIGVNLVFSQLLGQNGQICRLEPVNRQDAYLKMREYGFLAPGVLERTGIYAEEEKDCPQIQELAGKLYAQEKECVIQQKEIGCCLTQYSAMEGRKGRQLLIVSGVLEDYLTLSSDGQNLVYVYSDEKARELLEEMMGGRR